MLGVGDLGPDPCDHDIGVRKRINNGNTFCHICKLFVCALKPQHVGSGAGGTAENLKTMQIATDNISAAIKSPTLSPFHTCNTSEMFFESTKTYLTGYSCRKYVSCLMSILFSR